MSDADTSSPIAIVGISCRFAPDLTSPELYWEALHGGRSTVSTLPEERWQAYAAASPQVTSLLRATNLQGSFLDDVAGFDAAFFGISPKEADFLDPQQRIMLELTWEALERAGITPTSLGGSDTSVYMSANSNDYGRRLLEDLTATGPYAVNGTTYYGIANRISYALDLRGPSMAVDTACAGSLTALHQGAHSLSSGESDLAIIGGVNVMATPALFVALDAAGATAPDGRSKAFDASADGYGRGEGGGVVIMKRLTDAQRDHNPILALIRGSGVFQDGRSEGMMAPNGDAQVHMLSATYDRAGIDPQTVDYVEAHGTGTPVGDREEANALAAVFGRRNSESPCLIGSAKPNIGHVEAGSGVAGIIKVVQALQNDCLPPSLHQTPNPNFDWAGSGLQLVAEPTPWRRGGPRRAGVSSYGVGGSIAHVIVEEAPAPTKPEEAPPGARSLPVPVTAMSQAGLQANADKLRHWLQMNPTSNLRAVGATLATRRSHLNHRALLWASTSDDLIAQLSQLADGSNDISTYQISAGASHAPVTWVFSGHGSQWDEMGRDLIDDEPAFAEAVASLSSIYTDELGWDPIELLTAGGPWTSVQVQALTFAMQIGLAAVWRARGVTPDAVIGHSVGEIAAAVEAGALSRDEAARFACRRARSLTQAQGRGAMAMVTLPIAEVQERLENRSDVVAAIDSSPDQCVISGDPDAVDKLVGQLTAEGLGAWPVDTDIAFHSPHVDASIDAIREAGADLSPTAPQVPLYSTALADPKSSDARDGDYWVTNLRQRVRFTSALESAIDDGHRLFLEISAHPILCHSITEQLHTRGTTGQAIATMRRNRSAVAAINQALSDLYGHGAPINWAQTYPSDEMCNLPTQAWQHRRFWIFDDESPSAGSGRGHNPEEHSILGGRFTVSGSPSQSVWQTYLDMDCRPYPMDHTVVGVEITPAAVLIQSFLDAASDRSGTPSLSNMTLRTPLSVTPPRMVQVTHSGNTVRLASRLAKDIDSADARDANDWITHSTATLDWDLRLPSRKCDLTDLRTRCPDEWPWSRADTMFRRMGVGGYAFPWTVHQLLRGETDQLATMTIEPDADQARSWAHVIDGALTLSAVLVTPEQAPHQWMSSHIDSVVVGDRPPAQITVHSHLSPADPDNTVDVDVYDENDQLLCQVTGLTFSPIRDTSGTARPQDLVFRRAWEPLEDNGPAVDFDSVVIVGSGALATWAMAEIDDPVRCTTLADAAAYQKHDDDHDLVIWTPNGAGTDVGSDGFSNAADLLQTLRHAATCGSRPRVWALTENVREATSLRALPQGPVWGIMRIFAGEHPDQWGGVVDVDPSTSASVLWDLITHHGAREDIISVNPAGIAEVARLEPTTPTDHRRSLLCKPADTYLITGGLGALGLLTAQQLADRGARRLILASRSGLPDRSKWDAGVDSSTRRAIDTIRELENSGVTVKVAPMDVTDPASIKAATDPSVTGMPPVRGIIHAAGMVADSTITASTAADLAVTMAAKVTGTLALHAAFPPQSLDFLVLYSSCGQFAHLTGQASYAAANSFMDAFASYRHHIDGCTHAIGWTAWDGVGMSEDIAGVMLEAESRGLGAISVTEAFRTIDHAIATSGGYAAVLRPLEITAPDRVPMFSSLVGVTESNAEDQSTFQINADLGPAHDQLRSDICQQVGVELNMEPEEVDTECPLVEMGVDSVMTVALRVRMQSRYGVPLPPNILWSHPTVSTLGDYILPSLETSERRVSDSELVSDPA